ncbi:MAG: methyltransferase domain-containing protein [Pseudomonadota bacterium]
MAVVFSRKIDGVRYEVRNAGRSMRLYTNRVMHTQYHPEYRLTRGVWDLLALPAVALPQVKRVLLLGVGGGAAIHLLRHWCPGVHVTGVELNPVHLQLARRFFGLKGSDIELIEGDALKYVEQYKGKPFDMVIEDLFGGDGAPDRSFAADRTWCNALGRLVSTDGVLVINTLSRSQLRETALVSDRSVRKQWGAGFCLTLPAYANNVGVFYRRPMTAAELRRDIRADAVRLRQERAGQLRFQIAPI